MSIFDGLNIDIDTLIEGNKSEVLNKELSNTAKKNLDIQKRAGVEEIADQEEIIRLVYLIEEAPFDQSTSSQKRSVKDVIKTYRDDPNFFTQTGTENPIGKCKHILFNLLSSSEVAASIKRKYSPMHNWPSNFTTSDLHFKPPSSMDEAEVPARKKTRVADTKVVQGPTLLEPCEEKQWFHDLKNLKGKIQHMNVLFQRVHHQIALAKEAKLSFSSSSSSSSSSSASSSAPSWGIRDKNERLCVAGRVALELKLEKTCWPKFDLPAGTSLASMKKKLKVRIPEFGNSAEPFAEAEKKLHERSLALTNEKEALHGLWINAKKGQEKSNASKQLEKKSKELLDLQTTMSGMQKLAAGEDITGNNSDSDEEEDKEDGDGDGDEDGL